MKTPLIFNVTVLIIGLAAALSSRSVPNRNDNERACVILTGWQVQQHYGPGSYSYTDVGLYCSSSSSNAPQFPAPIFTESGVSNVYPMAEAIAQLLNQGFHVEQTGNYGMNVLMIK